jgi:hypothetical protein
MSSEKNKIRVVSEPTIILADMDTDQEMIDLTHGVGYKTDKLLGQKFPYIKIKDTRLLQEEIESMEIDCSNFLPILHINLIITRQSIIAQDLPKDGDIISIFIRSLNDVYKPIRNDYLITHVETNSLTEKTPYTFIKITGVLNIKNIWIEKNKAFKGTSLDVIKKVATELELGFATNIDTPPNDEMMWLCDWKSYKDFLIHISNYAWRNENTFYKIFIDIFYNVNFIEVEKQLDQTKELDKALAIFQNNVINISDPYMPIDEQPNVEIDLVLTNFDITESSTIKITNYELINNSSAISYSQGYGKKIYFYDHTLKTL